MKELSLADLSDNAINQIVEVVKPILEEKDKEIERLNGIIEIKTNRIQNLMSRLSKRAEKVKRLNNIIKKYEKMSFVHEIDLQNRIDKAIKYIEEQSKFIKGCDIYQICNKDVLLNILKGADKE